MNRPFSAFTSLMVLLGLAMFAVSSTTRSTTVQPARRSQAASLRLRRGAQRIVRPAQPSPAAREIDDECRDQVLVLASTEIESGTLACLEQAKSSLRSARIVAAVQMAIDVRSGSVSDCLSHYDPSYDRAVYGVSQTVPEPSATTNASLLEPVSAAELDSVFHDLVSRRSLPSHESGASQQPKRTMRWQAMVAAAGAWVKYQMVNVTKAGSEARVEWAEYAEFADGPRAATTWSPLAVQLSQPDLGVRSSD